MHFPLSPAMIINIFLHLVRLKGWKLGRGGGGRSWGEGNSCSYQQMLKL
jgi:hypothetical protein